jgi:hypothetical protein
MENSANRVSGNEFLEIPGKGVCPQPPCAENKCNLSIILKHTLFGYLVQLTVAHIRLQIIFVLLHRGFLQLISTLLPFLMVYSTFIYFDQASTKYDGVANNKL